MSDYLILNCSKCSEIEYCNLILIWYCYEECLNIGSLDLKFVRVRCVLAVVNYVDDKGCKKSAERLRCEHLCFSFFY